MAETVKDAVKFIEQGHIRVGPELVKDPAMLITRNLEDFITWVDSSAIRKKVLDYNGMVIFIILKFATKIDFNSFSFSNIFSGMISNCSKLFNICKYLICNIKFFNKNTICYQKKKRIIKLGRINCKSRQCLDGKETRVLNMNFK